MNELQTAYKARLDTGELKADPGQQEALRVFERLNERLNGYIPARAGFLRGLLGGRPAPQGIYLYGDVGRGKSMLMDLFFETSTVARKRRVHFHQFMLEIHQRLFDLQSEGEADLVSRLAKDIADGAWLLCFDEFHVTNIADAMILGRLFGALFQSGVVVVATSNWAPEDLYKNGLQRDRFLPFIDLIEAKMVISKLIGPTDHRLEKTQKLASIFTPLSEQNTKNLQSIFFELNGNAEPDEVALQVQGRALRLLHTSKGVGFFNFDELCVQPLGAADYLALARFLHTFLIDDVPKMTGEKRNETTRFINLVDALYEAKAQLFFCCEVPLDRIAPSGELELVFQRTVSRLIEMQSVEYKQLPHLGT